MFIGACKRGDKNEAKRLYERNPTILNQKDNYGRTGLMWSLARKQHLVSRWLLGLPGLDTASTAEVADTALHCACRFGAPLDIVAQLAELARRQGNLNPQTLSTYSTGLDYSAAVMFGHDSIALYLAWLGADCMSCDRRAGPVTLQTWLDEGFQQQAQYWALSADDSEALDVLASIENVEIDVKNLLNLAKFFNHTGPEMNLTLFRLNNSYLKLFLDPSHSSPDFKIICQGREFRCHKLFLVARSEYFSAMLKHDMKEAQQDRTELVICTNTEVADYFIQFFYTGQQNLVANTGEVVMHILDAYLYEFLELSDFYMVLELKRIAEDRMIELLDMENVQEFLMASNLFNGERIKTAALKFVVTRPELLEVSEELRLLVERLQEEQLEMQFREECQRLQHLVEMIESE